MNIHKNAPLTPLGRERRHWHLEKAGERISNDSLGRFYPGCRIRRGGEHVLSTSLA